MATSALLSAGVACAYFLAPRECTVITTYDRTKSTPCDTIKAILFDPANNEYYSSRQHHRIRMPYITPEQQARFTHTTQPILQALELDFSVSPELCSDYNYGNNGIQATTFDEFDDKIIEQYAANLIKQKQYLLQQEHIFSRNRRSIATLQTMIEKRKQKQD